MIVKDNGVGLSKTCEICLSTDGICDDEWSSYNILNNFDIGENKILKKTCSIGFACFPFSTQNPAILTWQEVVEVADHCMYAAKKSSRNAWVGLQANIDQQGDNIFTEIIEHTTSLIESNQLNMVSSITDTNKVTWMDGQ